MTRKFRRIVVPATVAILGVCVAALIGVCAYAKVSSAMLDSAAEGFDVHKNLHLTGDTLSFRDMPDCVRKAHIYASSYEQLVDVDGKVRRPISPKTTQLTIELIDSAGRKALTKSLEYAVPAKKAPTEESGNAKPKVIPALQEWAGTSGNFVAAGKPITLVVSAKTKADFKALKERAEFFAKELKYVLKTGNVRLATKEPTDGAAFIKLAVSATPETKRLGDEGYLLEAKSDGITITSVSPRGAFWGTRTILQVFAQNENAFPCGLAVDYPQYPLRGFMFDVGRKPVSMKMLHDVMYTMSYYKLNDFQVHLNDNYIWLHEYTESPSTKDATDEQKQKAIADVLEAAPGAFRLESDLVGENGIPLTATDTFYTKKEFSDFIATAKKLGVTIVPEFDVPGHALSFLRLRPELMYRGNVTKIYDVERAAMLDASDRAFPGKGQKTYRQETLEFVQSVFDEYLVGTKNAPAVFAEAPVIHIGTDEYYGNAEDYRAFASAMLKYIKKRGYTPRLWGSFSQKPGKTRIDGNGSQIDIWNFGWQNPTEALELGFDIINILDSSSYVVPSGTGSIGGYGDALNLELLYSEKWQPNFLEKVIVPAGHKKLLGSQWALWNDNQFRRATGLTDFDLLGRIYWSCLVFAEKNWNNGTDNSFKEFVELGGKTGFPPLSNPTYFVKNPDGEILFEHEFERVKSRTEGVFGSALKLDGNTKTLLSPKHSRVYGIAPGYTEENPGYKAEFWVKRAAGTPKDKQQILFANGTGNAVCAVQNGTGKFGVNIDSWEFSFDYTLPEEEWVKIALVAEGSTLTLYVNDEKIGTPTRAHFPETCKFTSFVFPLLYAGSETNGFVGLVDSLKITTAKGAKDAAGTPLSEAVRKAKKFAGKRGKTLLELAQKYEELPADAPAETQENAVREISAAFIAANSGAPAGTPPPADAQTPERAPAPLAPGEEIPEIDEDEIAPADAPQDELNFEEETPENAPANAPAETQNTEAAPAGTPENSPADAPTPETQNA